MRNLFSLRLEVHGNSSEWLPKLGVPLLGVALIGMTSVLACKPDPEPGIPLEERAVRGSHVTTQPSALPNKQPSQQNMQAAQESQEPAPAVVDLAQQEARPLIDPSTNSAAATPLQFRAPNTSPLPSVSAREPFASVTLKVDALTQLFSEVPQLRTLEGALLYFREDKGIETVLKKARVDRLPEGNVLTTLPLLWQASADLKLVVVTGRADTDSFVAAFRIGDDGSWTTASTLILEREPGPIVLGYDKAVAKRLVWALCWECRAESGRVTLRDDGEVWITQD